MNTIKSPVAIEINYDYSREAHFFADIINDREVIHLKTQSDADLSKVKYALVWKPDPILFSRMPDLEVLFSLGAGVDHVLTLPVAPDIPIVRFVDHNLTTRMSEWICLQCLMHLRQQRDYDARQKNHKWDELYQPVASDICVGIMGMGTLGQDAAGKLKTLGFEVAGWSRSRKQIEGITCYDGGELDNFLGKTDFLVGLLPLTDETTGIFNRQLFGKLQKNGKLGGPVFINAGRGGSQVEADIVDCLTEGTLKGASLDVFEKEPLSGDSALWDFDNVIITPHAAAVSSLDALARHVANQIERYEQGQELEYLVDRSRGY